MAHAVESSPSWADEPLKLIATPRYRSKKVRGYPVSVLQCLTNFLWTDMWSEGASHMCNVHNALFRGFNSIYQQATHVKDDDKAAFLGYCQTWVKFLKSHTEQEESGLFVKAEELLQEELFKDMVNAHGIPRRIPI